MTVVFVVALPEAAVTVTVEVPAGVPLFFGDEDPPPQPAIASSIITVSRNAHVANAGVRL